MRIRYRQAVPQDAAACIDIRSQTRENAFSKEELESYGVTPASIGQQIAEDVYRGYVCMADDVIVGYCFGELETAEIIVLALLPAYEGRGIGKHLLQMVLDDFVTHGHIGAYLGCSRDPSVRAYGFYRHLGWRSTGTFDAMNDEVLRFDFAKK